MDPTKKEEDAAVVQRSELDKITTALKENTVALVEMGIAVKKLENQMEYILKKGEIRG